MGFRIRIGYWCFAESASFCSQAGPSGRINSPCPVQFFIPYAAGGGGTINAEDLQSHFKKALGGPVQIMNKSGGAGIIAWSFVANSPANGYTTAIVNPSRVVTLNATKTEVSLDLFDPIAYTVYIPSGVGVKAESTRKTFKEIRQSQG